MADGEVHCTDDQYRLRRIVWRGRIAVNHGLAHRLSAERHDISGASATQGTKMPSRRHPRVGSQGSFTKNLEILAGRRRFTFPQGRGRIATATELLGQNINDNRRSTPSTGDR